MQNAMDGRNHFFRRDGYSNAQRHILWLAVGEGIEEAERTHLIKEVGHDIIIQHGTFRALGRAVAISPGRAGAVPAGVVVPASGAT